MVDVVLQQRLLSPLLKNIPVSIRASVLFNLCFNRQLSYKLSLNLINCSLSNSSVATNIISLAFSSKLAQWPSPAQVGLSEASIARNELVYGPKKLKECLGMDGGYWSGRGRNGAC
jgi:hypothetical protein